MYATTRVSYIPQRAFSIGELIIRIRTFIRAVYHSSHTTYCMLSYILMSSQDNVNGIVALVQRPQVPALVPSSNVALAPAFRVVNAWSVVSVLLNHPLLFIYLGLREPQLSSSSHHHISRWSGLK